jgi:SAM-dependent methyltransferase
MSADPKFSYDEIADAYAAGVETAPYNALYERPAMLAMMPPLEGLHVLDAGCGSGLYCELLLDRGARVTGMDESAGMLAHAGRRLAGRGVDLRVANLRDPLPFADGSFDAVVSALVLHYLRDWGATLAELRRVLRPDGWLLFSTHHPGSDVAHYRPPPGSAPGTSASARYLEVEAQEDTIGWVGRICFYRRPMSRIVNDLAQAGFAIERMDEPMPTDAFRRLKPERYARIAVQPEFLFIRARPWRR